MPIEERVFIAGAGPVGLAAAANLVRRGVPVTAEWYQWRCVVPCGTSRAS